MNTLPAIVSGMLIVAGELLAETPQQGPVADGVETGTDVLAQKKSDGASSEALEGSADAAIRRAVVRKLQSDPDVDIAGLEVVVQDGIVTLHGQAATSSEKHLAARYADDVDGSRGIVNAIDVVPGLR